MQSQPTEHRTLIVGVLPLWREAVGEFCQLCYKWTADNCSVGIWKGWLLWIKDGKYFLSKENSVRFEYINKKFFNVCLFICLLIGWIKSFTIFWYMLVSSMHIMQPKQFKSQKLSAMIGSIMVVGAVTCCVFLHSMCNLKATKMNVQYSLIHKLMLYKYQLGHNTAEATKNLLCERWRWSWSPNSFKNFTLVARTTMIGQGQTDLKGLILRIDSLANLVSISCRLSGDFDISRFSIVCHL